MSKIVVVVVFVHFLDGETGPFPPGYTVRTRRRSFQVNGFENSSIQSTVFLKRKLLFSLWSHLVDEVQRLHPHSLHNRLLARLQHTFSSLVAQRHIATAWGFTLGRLAELLLRAQCVWKALLEAGAVCGCLWCSTALVLCMCSRS